ncbi:MAG TPA: phosphate acyltransferase PlsX [Clostridia bacterium]|nr:phosphate acyltransferase PlsX [Clostridia bacterium]
MRIIVDVMGGDMGPREALRGAIEARREWGLDLIIVGNKPLIDKELSSLKREFDGAKKKVNGGEQLFSDNGQIQVVHAEEVIEPSEAPVQAIKRKPGSSLVTAVRLAKEAHGDAIVSAGSTGALIASTLMILGRAPNVDRPAIGVVFPTADGQNVLLIDAGANTEVRPKNLLQFAWMGDVFAKNVMHCQDPRVGLLNIGTERQKGTETVKSAYDLLEHSGLHFVGNVEPRDIPFGVADVVVCDGFVGNALLKFAEGIGSFFIKVIKDEIRKSPVEEVCALFLRAGLARAARRLDYTEYGGAPILGVAGTCIKCHGISNWRAFKNGIGVAKDMVCMNVAGEIAKAAEKTLQVDGFEPDRSRAKAERTEEHAYD